MHYIKNSKNLRESVCESSGEFRRIWESSEIFVNVPKVFVRVIRSFGEFSRIWSSLGELERVLGKFGCVYAWACMLGFDVFSIYQTFRIFDDGDSNLLQFTMGVLQFTTASFVLHFTTASYYILRQLRLFLLITFYDSFITI